MPVIQPSEKLRQAIKKDRSELKEISLNSYIVSLRSLFKRLNPGNDLTIPINTSFLKDKNKIMKDVEGQEKLTTKKNILTSVLVGLSSDRPKNDSLIDYYQAKLKDLSVKYSNWTEKQEKSDTQESNWISYDKFTEIINELLKDVKQRELTKKETLTRAEYTLLQKYVILSFYKVFPLRNDIADTAVLTQKEYDDIDDDVKSKNNYFTIDNKKYKLYLNQFKNVKRIGVKSYDIPDKLAKIVKLWLKHNKSGWLFTLNNARDPLSPNGVTKLLNSIFSKAVDKKISSSMLRHISISHKMKGEPSLIEKKKEEKEVEDKYMHSMSVHEGYRKLD